MGSPLPNDLDDAFLGMVLGRIYRDEEEVEYGEESIASLIRNNCRVFQDQELLKERLSNGYKALRNMVASRD